MLASLTYIALLSCASGVAGNKFALKETYDSTNFFDKFNFFESKFTGKPGDIDPAGGHVVYQNRSSAEARGLISYTDDGHVYVGVDHTTVGSSDAAGGRPSVRLESKNTYHKGLLIARFAHLPFNQCGVWQQFWTKGANRPHDGQIDAYEHWNQEPHNQPAFHTGNSTELGNCILDGEGQSAPVATANNCDNAYENPPLQGKGQGCSAVDIKGAWADKDGGVLAMEWTSEHIKIFSWPHASKKPCNIGRSRREIDTSHWGTPNIYLKNSHCDIDGHFAAQQLVLHTTFCGVAGSKDIWGQTCEAATGTDSCVDYVSQSPEAFKDVYWKIKDIRYFEQI